ncbi:MAG: hypothetical protein HOP09_05635 [Hyphomicrobium sp.]|nr:hypothetical protein [Hyphomicrobium sp.]
MSTRPRVNSLKLAMQGMQMAESDQMPMTAAVPAVSAASVRPPSRQGKRVVSAYLEATAAKQLRLLSAESDRSTQSLVEEALNDLFRKYGKSALC